MIEAHRLHKAFGNFQAVREISLRVDRGEVVALLGPNGAGKTTTVRMLGAILRPSTGRALVAGYDVVEQAREVRHVVGLLTEFPGLYHRMRSLEYLEFFGALQGMAAAESARRGTLLLQQFGLWDARDKRLDSYSKGMKQKIALIRALIHDPPVLFLDEPTTAMDPHSARTVRDAIADLRAARRTILLTTHNLVEAETLADRIVVVRGGQIVAEGTRAQLTLQLLGDPIWELRLGTPADGIAELLADLVPIEAVGDDWVQYRSAEGRLVNPQIVARLAARGTPIVALAELPRSLEDVYLSIVAEDQPERGAWSTNGQGDKQGGRQGDGATKPSDFSLSPALPISEEEEVQP
ncbi:MAG: ABC transporter ATP-binding protein [Kouleothrix sp.]|jgi:ABC-2 type transport system ATP-binding protein|nr:ABC transporter ATP-binding protein [Kouleothrix sp.]